MGGKDSDALSRIESSLSKVIDVATENLNLSTDIVKTLNDKVDSLISVASGKDRIPLDVFKWVVGALLCIMLCQSIGVQGVKDLISLLPSPSYGVAQEPPVAAPQ